MNKEEPTKEFVGKKGKTTEKESKKHHSITARGLGDTFSTGEDNLLTSDEEPLPLSLGQIGFFDSEGTQLVIALPLFFFAIFSLCATLLTSIQRRSARGLRGKSGVQGRCNNGGGRRTKNW
jgi:hypothetical protein